MEEFSTKYPDVSVKIEHGNHEELYELLRAGGADLVPNDQREQRETSRNIIRAW